MLIFKNILMALDMEKLWLEMLTACGLLLYYQIISSHRGSSLDVKKDIHLSLVKTSGGGCYDFE